MLILYISIIKYSHVRRFLTTTHHRKKENAIAKRAYFILK